ncbi:hypothetical protein HMPREF9193_00253 [Treponema lecithinolyticum ATCC 700332]|uniref:Uncharacterized protein n=1 Tax=Treponema lecithinolyticum ATCC 700332 TaxID=1321815 RepID=A0ABN0P1A6_TRELE|nr:hypothetical protein HMPREF9193_00253 [Treponema lecithinolyticum ATCC 700332]
MFSIYKTFYLLLLLCQCMCNIHSRHTCSTIGILPCPCVYPPP